MTPQNHYGASKFSSQIPHSLRVHLPFGDDEEERAIVRRATITGEMAPLALRTARDYGYSILDWLSPYSHQAQLAGSVRRDRPTCGDIDIVMIPRVVIERDMFGAESGRENLCWKFFANYVRDSKGKARILSGSEMGAAWSSYEILKCQLDLFFCTEETLVTTLICRTGSKEHNIWVARRANRFGMHWNPARGLLQLGTSGEQGMDAGPIRLRTEAEFYGALKLPFIDPRNREIAWLRKHFGP